MRCNSLPVADYGIYWKDNDGNAFRLCRPAWINDTSIAWQETVDPFYYRRNDELPRFLIFKS